MLIHSYKNKAYILITISLCILFASCLQKEPVPQVKSLEQLCPLPESKLISEAISEARNSLSSPDCAIRFNAIFEHLLFVAQNDPKPKNNKIFSEFLTWAKDNSIISARQTKEIYTSYFSHKFVALPRDYQTCSYCKDIDKLVQKMKEELRLKETGLLKICENRARYVRAKSDYVNMRTILKATCKACQAGD
jgi:hypothetical protein